MSLDAFATAEGEPGHQYELARGVVLVVDIPGLPHERTVRELNRQVFAYDTANPGAIVYHATGSGNALRLPVLQSERHPDLAIYLSPAPSGEQPWDTWIPDIVVEVVSRRSRKRDYGEKREEYLAAGVREYWIVDPDLQAVVVLERRGDAFVRRIVAKRSFGTRLLPGFKLDVRRLFAA